MWSVGIAMLLLPLLPLMAVMLAFLLLLLSAAGVALLLLLLLLLLNAAAMMAYLLLLLLLRVAGGALGHLAPAFGPSEERSAELGPTRSDPCLPFSYEQLCLDCHCFPRADRMRAC